MLIIIIMYINVIMNSFEKFNQTQRVFASYTICFETRYQQIKSTCMAGQTYVFPLPHISIVGMVFNSHIIGQLEGFYMNSCCYLTKKNTQLAVRNSKIMLQHGFFFGWTAAPAVASPTPPIRAPHSITRHARSQPPTFY